MSTKNLNYDKNYELVKKIKLTYGKPDLRDSYNLACEELLELNKGLILNFTNRYALYNKHNYDKNELFNYLQQYLIQGCLTYDETKSHFITYAYRTLSSGLTRYFDTDSAKVSTLNYAMHHKITQKMNELIKNGIDPNLDNLINSGISKDTLLEFFRAYYSRSINEEIVNERFHKKDDEREFNILVIEFINTNIESPEETAQENDKKELIRLAISYLKPEYEDIIRMYYFEQKDLSEILKERNCTRQGLHFTKNKALKQLKILLQPENLMAIKKINQLKQKNEEMLKNNKQVTYDSLIKNENITSSTLFKMLCINRNKFFCSNLFNLEKISNSNTTIYINSEIKEFVKDVILADKPEDISNKYNPRKLDKLLNVNNNRRVNVTK